MTVRQGAAFVTGGSSGIGLAAVLQLAARGHPVALFARDPDRLSLARDRICAHYSDAVVLICPVDVTDRAALMDAVDGAAKMIGPPVIAIASAGIAGPGLFLDQPFVAHERQMAVNYFGTLWFVQSVVPLMAAAGGGKIGLVSSGAGQFGIYGYSAYAASKFAVRGLAEVLRVELRPCGIGVTLIYPPDTDTPQLRAEAQTKPAATTAITAGAGLWTADRVAACLIRGLDCDRFCVIPGWGMALLHQHAGLLAPLVRAFQARVLRRLDG
jgi:3-dehydrosphinganine reductase